MDDGQDKNRGAVRINRYEQQVNKADMDNQQLGLMKNAKTSASQQEFAHFFLRFFVDHRPARQLCPHLWHPLTTLEPPRNPANSPTPPARIPPATACPKPKPRLAPII